MLMRVHCPDCEVLLTVPMSAAGSAARCPKCQHKFLIQTREDLIDDAVSSWIEDDVDHFEKAKTQQNDERILDHDKHFLKPSKTSDDFIKHLTDHHHPPHPPTHPASAEVSNPDLTPLNANIPMISKATETIDPPMVNTNDRLKISKPKKDLSNETIHGSVVKPPPSKRINYSRDLKLGQDRPQLIIKKCTVDGVVLAFDSHWLNTDSFRASMPARCVFTGGDNLTDLRAKPLAFVDRSQAAIRNATTIEMGHEHHLLQNQGMMDLLHVMGILDGLPGPFDLAMPYFTDREHLSSVIYCKTTTRPDMGISCEITIPCHEVALEWLMRVNGVCSDDYHLLAYEIGIISNDSWKMLSEKCRHNMEAWCHFNQGENLSLYVRDADLGKSDDGLAGLVVTDKRIIFHKYHHNGEIDLTRDATLIARKEKRLYRLSLIYGQHQTRVGNIHEHDLDDIREALAQSNITVKVPAPKPTNPV